MSKNVLILSASPRKGGNSDLLCDEFLKGSLDAGNKAEKIFLKNKNIGYCTGCGVCFGGKPCSQKDDMGEVLEKMIDADVIVMATPVYFYAMNGQMKTLIDRTCARYQEINNKEFYFIVAAADGSKALMQRTIEEFRGFTYCLSNPKEKGIVYGTGAWQIGDIKGKPSMNEAYTFGKNA
ncbi:flavodoxin family protein [Sulfurospirillum arsenophilum]|uniref:flavodoxin family protein n=1 Tax=Sulfurospirillum arsenophilum TaxID=56698 RepID=UPI0005A928D5|nr:flavodoxin family protein [Sulfurospirillum arsenophilum]